METIGGYEGCGPHQLLFRAVRGCSIFSREAVTGVLGWELEGKLGYGPAGSSRRYTGLGMEEELLEE